MALVCAAGSAPPAHEWHQGSLLATRVIVARPRFMFDCDWRLTRYLRFLAGAPPGETLPFNTNLNSGGATR